MSKPNPSAPPAGAWGAPPPQHGYGVPYSQPPPNPAGYGSPYSSWGQHPPPNAYNQAYSQAYPSPYPGYPPQPYGSQHMFPPGTDHEIIQAFQNADRDGSGLIDEVELQRALSVTSTFSIRTVRLMMMLFGPKNSKKIGPPEFATLWRALKDWKAIFQRFDKDHSGTIDKTEMRDALLSLGYAIAPPILDCLLQNYDRTGQAKAMDYDSFVECGLIVKGLTEKFKEQDTQLKGSATMDYQTFMLMVLPFIVA